MIITRFMTPEDTDAVRRFVQFNPYATIYHTLAWKKVLETTYGYASRYIVCLTDNRISGVLPLVQMRNFKGQKKIVGLPFSHHVQPLYDSLKELNALRQFSETIAHRMNVGFLEIKCNLGEQNQWRRSSAYMVSELYLNRDIQDIYAGFKPSVRRNIRRAEASSISIRTEKSKQALDQFYELMVETRQRQGSLPYARCFFNNVFRYLDLSKRRLYLAYHGLQPIAGLMMLFHGKRAIYAYGASKSDKALLKFRPNDLLFWRSITDAHAQGFDVYDFGITPSVHHSLLRFKSQWGTETRKLSYSYFMYRARTLPRIDRSGGMMRVASAIFQTLPTPVYKLVGPIVIRYLG